MTMRKPLLIGQAPARLTLTHKAFDTASGPRLAGLMGLPSVLHIHRMFECHNLMDWYPGRAQALDIIPTASAQLAARYALPDLRGRVVLLLGRDVANTFGLSWLECLSWTCAFGAKIGLAPHPSPANRWWNTTEAVAGTRVFMREFAHGTLHRRNDHD